MHQVSRSLDLVKRYLRTAERTGLGPTSRQYRLQVRVLHSYPAECLTALRSSASEVSPILIKCHPSTGRFTIRIPTLATGLLSPPFRKMGKLEVRRSSG